MLNFIFQIIAFFVMLPFYRKVKNHIPKTPPASTMKDLNAACKLYLETHP